MSGPVLVTGGSGRLGRTVVDVLRTRGHDVVSADLVPRTGGAADAREELLDMRDSAAVETLVARVRPSAIVHLAAIAVPFSAPDDVIFHTNLTLAESIVRAAVRHGVGRVLLASSPTVLGYGDPKGWTPVTLPLDEDHPVRAWHGYSASKVEIEQRTRAWALAHPEMRWGAFRPCFVISPEEWHGALTQQGHTVRERLDDPALAAVALFNYVDARDVGEFVHLWLERAQDAPNGEVYFVGAEDALAYESLDTLLPRYLPAAADAARALRDGIAAFSSAKAHRDLGWRARRSWRDELAEHPRRSHPSPTPAR